MAMQGTSETEVKIPIVSVSEVAERLWAAGFRPSVPRLFEVNTLYDNENHELRSADSILRLREIGGKCLVTFKGKSQAGPHKTREEIETSLGSVDAMRQIFAKLGYRPAFRYEKYRTEFTRPAGGKGVVTMDETPIGSFLELEGAGEWIDETATALGFSHKDYVLESYGRLYLADCERRGVEPGDMVFAS
jgi:adenylate cyclase, class 2